MAYAIRMPKLGETMTEGTIVEWFKVEKDAVEKGEPLFAISTDKTIIEVDAPEDGILARILVKEDETAEIGTVVGLIAGAGEEVADFKLGIEEEDISGAEKDRINDGNKIHVSKAAEVSCYETDKVKASPAAKRLAKENGINLSALKNEKDKPIVAKDVIDYLESSRTRPEFDDSKEAVSAGTSMDQEVPLTGIRRITARRMTASFRDIPQVTLTTRAHMEEIISQRKRLQEVVDKHLTFTDFINLAVVRALKKNPELNAHVSDDSVVLKEDINLGIAVSISNGLVVPVVKGAERLGLEALAERREALVEKARTNKLTEKDLEGGTFTVSNLGSLGTEIFTPIINPPEAAILGVGKISKEPIVINDEIVIKPVLWLSLTFDHRAVDGAPAAEFLRQVKEFIENPERMLLA